MLGYNSNLYSDQEGLESDNRLQFDDNHRTDLYDSLLSLNTVIENPSSRLTVHDGETQSLIEPNDSLTLSIPWESGVGSDLTITEINAVDANFTFSEKKSDEEPKENVQPDLPNVENTMDGEYTSEEPSLLSSEVSTEHLYLKCIAALCIQIILSSLSMIFVFLLTNYVCYTWCVVVLCITYCMAKTSKPCLHSDALFRNEQDFFDIQHLYCILKHKDSF